MLLEYFDDWIANNVNYLHKKQLSFMKSINGNVYNENPFFLLIDEICLSKFLKDNKILVNIYTQKELLSKDIIKTSLSENNKKIFLFSYDPTILILFS